MEHFLLYSLVLCIASFLSIYLTKAPEELYTPSENQDSNDGNDLKPAASASPSSYAYPLIAEEAEEEYFGSSSRPLAIDLSDVACAVSDNQNPYF